MFEALFIEIIQQQSFQKGLHGILQGNGILFKVMTPIFNICVLLSKLGCTHILIFHPSVTISEVILADVFLVEIVRASSALGNLVHELICLFIIQLFTTIVLVAVHVSTPFLLLPSER